MTRVLSLECRDTLAPRDIAVVDVATMDAPCVCDNVMVSILRF